MNQCIFHLNHTDVQLDALSVLSSKVGEIGDAFGQDLEMVQVSLCRRDPVSLDMWI